MPGFETNFDDPEVTMLRCDIVDIFAANAFSVTIQPSFEYDTPITVVLLTGVLTIDKDSWNVTLTEIIRPDKDLVITYDIEGYPYDFTDLGIEDKKEGGYLNNDEVEELRDWIKDTEWESNSAPSLIDAEAED